MTKIKCKKDLYNDGLCFTKGKTYDLPRPVHEPHQLMNIQLTNDQGQPHNIGIWYKHFTLIK